MADLHPIISALPRAAVGRTPAAVRRAGYIPAILYGHGVENVPVAIEAKGFVKLLPELSSSTLLTVQLPETGPRRVLVQDVQRDPLTGRPIHVDFHQVKLTEKIRTKVPLVATGVSPAVRDQGGVLIQSVSEIEVEALPGDLPRDIPFDLAKLATFEDRITVADLVAAPTVAVHAKPDEVVAVVAPPKTEEELKAELEAPVEAPAVAEVKTEAEEKKAAEEAEKAAEQAPEGEEKPAGKKEGKTERGAASTRG